MLLFRISQRRGREFLQVIDLISILPVVDIDLNMIKRAIDTHKQMQINYWAVVSALTTAARHGVLIKGGFYLEQLGTLHALAFDKTGTLSQGYPSVNELMGAFDVYDIEPIPEDDPLRGRDNVIHVPHIAGRTRDSNLQAIDIIVEDFARILQGDAPLARLTREMIDVRLHRTDVPEG